MSITRSTSVISRSNDHFEPDDGSDPQAQRRLRGHLEQIDYIAYAANREVVGAALKSADPAAFQRLAVAVAQARARWVGAALAATESGQPPTREDIERIAALHRGFQEMTGAYEGLRRLVERGYLPYAAR